jgi:hypothetical protein
MHALAPGAASAGTGELGVGAGFIDDDQTCRIKRALGGLPGLPRRGQVGAVLLGGAQRFFEADPVPLKQPAQRAVRRGEAMRLRHPCHNLGQGQVGLGRHQRQQPRRVQLERLRPPRDDGLMLPVSACRLAQRTAEEALTRNRSAAARRQPPAATSAPTRDRRSSECVPMPACPHERTASSQTSPPRTRCRTVTFNSDQPSVALAGQP